jgi:hypothetical protein
VRTSQRSRSTRTYTEADEDGSDIIDEDDLIPVTNSRFIEGMEEERWKVDLFTLAIEVEGDTIEKILDHRIVKADGSAIHESDEEGEYETKTEYFVKWQGWAHIHNTYLFALILYFICLFLRPLRFVFVFPFSFICKDGMTQMILHSSKVTKNL